MPSSAWSRNATAKGANAIVMMRFDSSEIGQTMSEIVAYGTAVVIEPVSAWTSRRALLWACGGRRRGGIGHGTGLSGQAHPHHRAVRPRAPRPTPWRA